MFRRGRRLFTVASIALIVVACLHAIGHFSPPPSDPAARALLAAMRAYRIPLGLGMQPSILDIQQSLSLTMAITLLWLGLQNLAAAAADGAAGQVVRRLNVISVLGVGTLVGVFGFYRIPPPFTTLAVVEVLFLLALLLPTPGTPGSGGDA
jgi:hypothetical protein